MVLTLKNKENMRLASTFAANFNNDVELNVAASLSAEIFLLIYFAESRRINIKDQIILTELIK